jgi:Na+-driven multidrug efflux pump
MVSGGMAFYYLRHYKTATIRKEHLIIRKKYLGRIMSLGAAPCSNQVAMMVVQIIMNKSLAYYGALSVYGESIPLASVGIITKVNQVFFSFIIGISQGLQPIVSFNYGAGRYDRVKKAYIRAVSYGFGISLIAFLMFQFLPRQIISLFGDGSDAYYQFAISYFRIFLLFTFLNFLQPITSNFFTAIGKPQKGIFLSLTRQILFLLPLILILPLLIGIDGILFAGPIADFVAGMVAIIMISKELKSNIYLIKNE